MYKARALPPHHVDLTYYISFNGIGFTVTRFEHTWTRVSLFRKKRFGEKWAFYGASGQKIEVTAKDVLKVKIPVVPWR